MKKILLVIEREYVSRVKKKTFLLATLLTPLLFPLIIGGVIYLAANEEENREARTIQILGEQPELQFNNNKRYEFIPVSGDSTTVFTAFKESDDYALLDVTDDELKDFVIYTKSSLSLSEREGIERYIEGMILQDNIKQMEMTPEEQAMLKPSINLKTYDVVSQSESNSGAAFGAGYISGFLIYIFIFLYGAQVMQGVIAEKSNKIVEVIIASVKPFQLMLGKVIGVASVGLTQFLLWVILVWGTSTIVFNWFGIDNPAATGIEFLSALQSVDFIPIIITFLFYFIGGYFLYGALFAAVGSAVDNPSEAQQFMFPITLPLIASIIGLTVVLNNPNGNVAFWLSIIPFTSPVTMMGRMGFGTPPLWELALSMTLLIVGIVFSIWVASRIYRVGILMHGSKVNYKTLVKWFMQSN